ncbi:MAG: heavy metal translocating P-type ATPase [Dongiaceae bacterium]
MAEHPARPPAVAPVACRHCGEPIAAAGAAFCCAGCAAAFGLIGELGLGDYYRQRCLDPAQRAPRPEAAPAIDAGAYVRRRADGLAELHLMVDGLHCGACVWLIEGALRRQPAVAEARVSLTTRRLRVAWRAGEASVADIVGTVARLGYRAVPFDPAALASDGARREKALLRCLAVAGFAAGNVMLLSVSVWAGHAAGMDAATRAYFHWISALIVLPAVFYAGRPFFASAWAALRARRTNMDVPISLAVLLTPAISLFETFRGGEHAYFDSSITLLFFLLIGRYLDSRARGRARATAEQLLALGGTAVTVIDAAGRLVGLPPAEVEAGMTVLVAAGARIGVDGRVLDGAGSVDASHLTGESVPVEVAPGDRVFAGSLNLSAPLRVEALAAGEDTLLAEIVRLMEAAEQGRARYVALADRVARLYAPVVHSLAALTFAGWMLLGSAGWEAALLAAIAVLIVTCPCALALAVPVVQVVATSRLLRQGVLIKSATARARLCRIDRVVLDKTGTVTSGRPELVRERPLEAAALQLAASIAAVSRHPLAQALVRGAPPAPPAAGVVETAGAGLSLRTPAGEVRLGSRRWCGIAEDGAAGPEMWLTRPGQAPVGFAFRDGPRPDAAPVIAALARRYRVELLSGDREATVAAAAESLGIAEWRAGCSPADKTARLAALAATGERVLMVGDGINDAPALAAAAVSMAPAGAADIAQSAADIVFQGDRLAPVEAVLSVARRADRLVRQNFVLTFVYNLLTIPLAMAGQVTPLYAAIAMSGSSLLVIGNAMRLGRR